MIILFFLILYQYVLYWLNPFFKNYLTFVFMNFLNYICY